MAARFPLGQVVVTPGALEQIGSVGAYAFLERHAWGDWGDLGAFDRRENDRALRAGERLFSAYETPAGRLWIVTERDLSVTTILVPEEY